MALTGKSLFLYGFEVTENNRSIDFRRVGAGPELQATLTLGFYSLTSLATEIVRAMQEVDALNEYTVSVDRTLAGGTENRVTIATDGAYLDLLFGSGSRAASSIASLIGFAASDRTGATSYEGTSSAGTTLQPEEFGYQYLDPDKYRKINGSVNISTSGVKESIVFQIQKFWQVQFKYEPETKVNTEWKDLMTWMIQQRRIEFTPNIGSPSTFFDGTLERTTADGQGLGYIMKEMLPQFPFFYDTGVLLFRQAEE